MRRRYRPRPLSEWEALCLFHGNRCLCCGKHKPLTRDHVIPVSKGGPDTIGNLQPLCVTCNNTKADTTRDYR